LQLDNAQADGGHVDGCGLLMTPADDLLHNYERRIADLEPQRKAQAVVMTREDAATPTPNKSPPGWIFTPHRDDNGLIIQIVARPIDG